MRRQLRGKDGGVSDLQFFNEHNITGRDRSSVALHFIRLKATTTELNYLDSIKTATYTASLSFRNDQLPRTSYD